MRVNATGGNRIGLGQPFMQDGAAVHLGFLRQTITNGGITGWSVEKPSQECFDIERRSAHEKDLFSSAANVPATGGGLF